MVLKLSLKKNKVFAEEPEAVSSLQNGFYGKMKGGKIELYPEEVMYLVDVRNAMVFDEKGNQYRFNEIAKIFGKRKKLLARYFTFKDWRDRGLIIRPASEAIKNYGRSVVKNYREGTINLDKFGMEAVFYEDDLISIMDDEETGRYLYENYWFGQFGTYKAAHRGKISKLDIYETLFLSKYANLKIKNYSFEEIMKVAKKRIKYFEDMLAVYEDWRNKGYVLKTGFKFGTHFRIYFPGASPVRSGKKWMHSQHVIHIFPRRSKLLISEWARAIRVAHSVRKTFILAIPGKKIEIKVNKRKPRLDFLLYHRKRNGVDTPKEGNPKYLMYSLSEDEYLGGEELAKALEECKHYGLEMLIAIADRESSVTYYEVKRINLPNSKYDYFEIEWIQP